jgi:hypothetical protein
MLELLHAFLHDRFLLSARGRGGLNLYPAPYESSREAQQRPNLMRDVFVSYSTKDREFVERLCAGLKAAGVTFWLVRHEIKPGDYLRTKINKGLDTEPRRFDCNFRQLQWTKTRVGGALGAPTTNPHDVEVTYLFWLL